MAILRPSERFLVLVGVAELLGALPGYVLLVVLFIDGDRLGHPLGLFVGEFLPSAPPDEPDPVERVALAAPVPVDLLLDPTADLIKWALQSCGGVSGAPVVA